MVWIRPSYVMTPAKDASYVGPSYAMDKSVKDALHNESCIRDIMHDMTLALLTQYVMLWILVDAIPFNSEDAAQGEIIWWKTANGGYSA
jgi:hypothetical protein